MKLLKVDTVEEARKKVRKCMADKPLKVINKPLLKAEGYVLAEDIKAEEALPSFDRSVVDGYAVLAADTAGSAESIPVFLKLVGEVRMGTEPKTSLHPGECMYVPTGGALPQGADAMVMTEYCEAFSETEIAVYESVPAGAHMVYTGDDMGKGQTILKRGTKIRPQEIGALSALGRMEVPVFEPWSVTIISTGDELVSPAASPLKGQVRDINTYGIGAQADRMKLRAVAQYVLKDERQLLCETVQKAMSDSDLVVVSGGSSQGKKDETSGVIEALASEGAFTHGLALKPGKPTILGFDVPTQTLLMGLPGHPVAAMLVFELLIGWLWRTMTGEKEEIPITAVISTNLPSAPGRKTCQLVSLENEREGIRAVPVFGRSGLISVLTRADGYILIEENQEGLRKGEKVFVYRL